MLIENKDTTSTIACSDTASRPVSTLSLRKTTKTVQQMMKLAAMRSNLRLIHRIAMSQQKDALVES